MIPVFLLVVYTISLVLFGLSLLGLLGWWFFLIRQKPVKQLLLGAVTRTVIVFAANTLLYVALLVEQGTVFVPDKQQYLPWARWAVYAASCAVLAYEIAGLAYLGYFESLAFVVFISVTLMCGLFSVLSMAVAARWVWFGSGFVFYASALLILLMKSKWRLFLFVLLTWTCYPIVLLFSPAFVGSIDLGVESLMYLLLDCVTKLGFSAYTIYYNTKEQAQLARQRRGN